MKQFVIIIHLLIISIAMICAQQVTRDEAVMAAVNTLRYEYRDGFTNRRVDTVFSLRNNGNTILFEVYFSDNKIVLLTGHKSCVPVVGILQDQTVGFDNGLLANMGMLSPGLQYFLENYIEQVVSCFRNSTAFYNDEWDALQFFDENREGNNRSVSPIISSKWGQRYSNDNQMNAYNHFTPTCPTYGHCPAGCVAVAMVQIMKRWNYPSFIPNTCRHYNWDVMPDSLVSNTNYVVERDSIARFLLDCGTEVNMQYCGTNCSKNESSAGNPAVPIALKHFGYNSTNVKYRSSYTPSGWDSLIRHDLDNGMPVYYSGYGSDGGHAFICDGYNNNGFYHFNWGWRGHGDGWFVLNDLTPGDYSFTSSQCAIFNIHPSSCWENIVFGCDRSFVHKNASYHAENTIQNNYHVFAVLQDSHVTFKAGDEIILTDGFRVGNGGDFVAKIEACEPDDGDGMPNLTEIGERSLGGDVVHRVPTTTVDDGLVIYPNPTGGTLTVESASPIREITVYDLSGRVVMTVGCGVAVVETCCSASLQQPYAINVSSLQNGIYLLKAVTDSGVQTARFVKN